MNASGPNGPYDAVDDTATEHRRGSINVGDAATQPHLAASAAAASTGGGAMANHTAAVATSPTSTHTPNAAVEAAVKRYQRRSCPICLERFTAENPSLLYRCGHSYHLQCAESWLARCSRCPVCDRDISTEDALLDEDCRPRQDSRSAPRRGSSLQHRRERGSVAPLVGVVTGSADPTTHHHSAEDPFGRTMTTAASSGAFSSRSESVDPSPTKPPPPLPPPPPPTTTGEPQRRGGAAGSAAPQGSIHHSDDEHEERGLLRRNPSTDDDDVIAAAPCCGTLGDGQRRGDFELEHPPVGRGGTQRSDAADATSSSGDAMGGVPRRGIRHMARRLRCCWCFW